MVFSPQGIQVIMTIIGKMLFKQSKRHTLVKVGAFFAVRHLPGLLAGDIPLWRGVQNHAKVTKLPWGIVRDLTTLL